jgi:hypothetical protein
MLRSIALATLLIGHVFASPSSAQPAAPAAPTPAVAATIPLPLEQLSPEELKRRQDYSKSMMQTPAPKKGCFQSNYPKTEWEEIPCTTTPPYPQPPRRGARPDVVGNSNDIAAQAPSGFISTAVGSFSNVTNVTSESGPIGNSGPAVANAYTLQLNTNFFASNVCAGSPNPGCQGWQQFVFENTGTSGRAYIQYWLIRYNAACPAGQNWNQFSFTGSTDIYCWKNNSGGAVAAPNQPIANLGQLSLSGTVSATGDSVTVASGGSVFTRTGDNAVNAAAGWQIAEFNIFGDGGNSAGGGIASFNSGASVVTRTEIIYGGRATPNCVATGFTAETNNLSFGPTAPTATQPGPAVIFEESIAGGATSNCAAATTIGDTHLATFDRLFYDFQASGDFLLAQVDPDFTVQTRQVSGAPTWPNATVNHAVAARFGKTQVAVCLAPAGRDQSAGLYADGKLTALDDGKALSLPAGVDILRRGNVYLITSESGDSVRAEVNPTWINVRVGLGRWPISVRGLIANANGNVNQIATRGGVVLTNPFAFEELYHPYADSWRVAPGESLLSVCGDREIEIGAPERAFFSADLEPEVQRQGRGVCAAAGVKAGPLFEACTLDVAVIGQDAAAKAFVGASPPAAVGGVVVASIGNLPGFLPWLLLLLACIFAVWLLIIG